MGSDEVPQPKVHRRSVLSSSALVAVTGLFAGCDQLASQRASSQSQDQTGDSETGFSNISGGWLTFGDEDDWGIRYNRRADEFEVVHKPFEEGSRRNIRIEADDHSGDGDKGDLYFDDTVIVENEVEVPDGTQNDPSYTFTEQNNTGFWRDSGGVIGVTTNGSPTAKFDNGTMQVAGDIATADDSESVVWDEGPGHTPNLPAVTATKSGDGSTATFSFSHPLNSAPRVATVTPTSADAAGEFWVSSKSVGVIEITYSSPPKAGEGNLKYDIIVSL